MIITNKLGLPKPLVDMATQDYVYKDNEYRVTSLLKGIRGNHTRTQTSS